MVTGALYGLYVYTGAHFAKICAKSTWRPGPLTGRCADGASGFRILIGVRRFDPLVLTRSSVGSQNARSHIEQICMHIAWCMTETHCAKL